MVKQLPNKREKFTISIVTTTRAEYGLLYPLIKSIIESEHLELQLIVSGTHLEEEYGLTKTEIIDDGITEFDEIYIMNNLQSDENNTSKIMGNVLNQMQTYLKSHIPDLAIVIGDRYEMLAFAIAFANARIPIAHISGGEITEGLLDEAYRHSLTKISHLHFTNCEIHRKRVIQLGEQPDRVFNVGDTSIDNVLSVRFIDERSIRNELRIPDHARPIVVTYHPVTLETGTMNELDNMLYIIRKHSEFYYVFTKANADYEGEKVNERIEGFVEDNDNTILVDSLGMQRYLSLLRFSVCMIGNSSSGLTEAPLFHIPTINIGNRQKGRVHGRSVIDCGSGKEDIEKAFQCALDSDFLEICKHAESVFGDGHAAEKMVEIIEKKLHEGISIEKTFYDISFEVVS